MRTIKQLSLLLVILLSPLISNGQTPVYHWDFAKLIERTCIENISGISDTVEGYTSSAKGVIGNGLKMDGFTSCVKTKNRPIVKGNQLSIESWVSLGNYPWNWCPIISTVSDDIQGYRLQVGPLGQVSFEVAVGEQWLICTSEQEALPLRAWTHITGTYEANNVLKLFINGKLVSQTQINGEAKIPNHDYIIGMDIVKEGCSLFVVSDKGYHCDFQQSLYLFAQSLSPFAQSLSGLLMSH